MATKILVTGGTGFTGAHLVRRLLRKGHQVRVIDKRRGLVFDELEQLGAQIQIGNILDAGVVSKMMAGCELVFHLAAEFRLTSAPSKDYWQANVEGTRIVADVAHRCGVKRFIHCSTEGVHGDVRHPPADEDSPIRPSDVYQQTKWEAERVMAKFSGRGMEVVTLRPTAIYGPGDPGRFLLLFRMVRKGFFPMFCNGKTLNHPVYLDNLLDGIELAAETPGISGRVFLIGDARYLSLSDLVRSVGRAVGVVPRIIRLPYPPFWLAALVCEVLCRPLGIQPPIFRRRIRWYRHDRAFSIDRATRELGYRPAIDLDEGLARTFDWYRRNGFL